MDFLKDFGVQPVLLAAQVVNFLLLLFILKKFLYGPILKALDTRREKIAESLKNADEIEKRLAEIEERQEQILAKASKEGEKLIVEASTQATQIVEDGRKKAEDIIRLSVEDAKGVIEVERQKLSLEIRENMTNIVSLVMQKVTGKVISKKDQKDIIDKEVKNIS